VIRGTRAGYQLLSGCGLNMFTDDELDEIHRATLDVLEDAGLMVLSDEAQEILYSHGCKVDKKTNTVKIPPYLVEDAIRSAPSQVLLAGRKAENDVVLGGKRVAFTSFGVAVKVLDLETGKVRESTKKDVAEAALLCDALSCVDILVMPLTPRDVPSQVADLHTAEAAFTNTSKNYFNAESLSTKSVRLFFEMGAAIMGGTEEVRRRPVGSMGISPVSPLKLGDDCCQVIVECARLGIPLNICSQALSGGTGPVTLAGTLVVHNVEVLGSIVLSQLTKKGAPVMYGSSTCPLDLRGAIGAVGSPELGMISAAVANLAQYYNLPSFVAGT